MISNIDHRLEVTRDLAVTQHPQLADINMLAQCLYEVLKHLEVNGTIKPKIVGAGIQDTLYGDKELKQFKENN